MSDWTMVRVKRATRERLRAFLESQLQLADNGRTVVPESGRPGGGDPSVDWQINVLLDRLDAHRERARKAARKKKGIVVADDNLSHLVATPQGKVVQLPALVANNEWTEEVDQADVIAVVPETPLEKFRDIWAFLAATCEVDALDSAEYQRVLALWHGYKQPEWCSSTIVMLATTAMPPCPNCGTPMVGGAPHGPWPVQYECPRCHTIVVPISSPPRE